MGEHITVPLFQLVSETNAVRGEREEPYDWSEHSADITPGRLIPQNAQNVQVTQNIYGCTITNTRD